MSYSLMSIFLFNSVHFLLFVFIVLLQNIAAQPALLLGSLHSQTVPERTLHRVLRAFPVKVSMQVFSPDSPDQVVAESTVLLTVIRQWS